MKMRPLLFLLSMAIATVPALEKVCDLRCATASALPTSAATASASQTHHCAEMPERPKPAPDSRDSGDPCGHGHGGGALIGVASRAATDGGHRTAPALFPSPGSFEPAGLAGAGHVRPVLSAESPPQSASSSILRL
jgi:hypothetical protein